MNSTGHLTVQTQQRAERDVAIARLKQSRIVLALRLADHHGKKYKVIEEARAFVGESKLSSIANHLGGVLGNTALFTVSMLALLHLHQVNNRGRYISHLQQIHEVNNCLNKNMTKVYLPEGGSTNGLDVLLARG
ncbi:plastid division protein PDV1 [Tanacetum coccineum]